MRPGDVFNPYRRACGFYPPDMVSRMGPFVLLKSRRKFTSAHKLLYVLLVRRWGRQGPCFPSQKRLASDLGMNERTIRRTIEDLEEFGLISRRTRGRGKGGRGQADEYSFLWHAIFDRPKSRTMTGQNELYDRPKPNVPYKEEACTTQPHTRETRQHHQRDDVACTAFEEEVLALAGVRLSASNLAALREIASTTGGTPEQIRGGVALGRLRHGCNTSATPIASFRFFANPIAEAVKTYGASQLEHTVRRLKRELEGKGILARLSVESEAQSGEAAQPATS